MNGQEARRLIAGLAGVLGIGLCGCWLLGPSPQWDLYFDVSPTDDEIVFVGGGEGERDLYLLQLSTLQVTRIAKTSGYERTPSFSPDGRSVVYAYQAGAFVTHPGHIFVRSLDGQPPKQLTSGKETSDDQPSLSADGSLITFARAHRLRPYSMGGYVWDDWDVYVMDADGTNLRRITQQKYRSVWRPQFSPDKVSVIFGAGACGGNLYQVPVAGTRPPAVLNPVANADHSVSRDGKRIVFISDQAKRYNYDLYLMDSDGTNIKRVTDNDSYNERPVIAPDGHRILFLSWAHHGEPMDRSSLWEVDIKSGRLNRIADPSLFDEPLKWKPADARPKNVRFAKRSRT